MSRIKVRSEGVAWQTVDRELIVLDERRSTYLKIVGSGNDLWPMVVEGTSVTELAERLTEGFGIDLSRARSDAELFVAELVSNDLLDSDES